MYRIAIGDDDPLFLKELEGTVKSCLISDGLEWCEDFEIAGLQRPDALKDALLNSPGSVQLLLVDTEFGPANGLEMAARLWGREQGRAFSLIYITSHEDYVLDSFDTRPLHYLQPLQKKCWPPCSGRTTAASAATTTFS